MNTPFVLLYVPALLGNFLYLKTLLETIEYSFIFAVCPRTVREFLYLKTLLETIEYSFIFAVCPRTVRKFFVFPLFLLYVPALLGNFFVSERTL